MKYVALAILVVILSGISLTYHVEHNYGGSLDTFWYGRKSDCELELPWNMKVVYNEKVYAIQTLMADKTHEYLDQHSDEIDTHFRVWTTFPDSCTAKSFAFRYVEQEKSKKSFREVKPKNLQETVKTMQSSVIVFVNYQPENLVLTKLEQQILDGEIKAVQAAGGGSITVVRNKDGFYVNAQKIKQPTP